MEGLTPEQEAIIAAGRQAFHVASQQAQEHLDKTVLGKHRVTGSEVVVKDVDRQSGMYVLGVQGVGKSSLLESLIYQDICKGYPVIVLDPHGDLIDHVLAQMPGKDVARTSVLDIEDIDYPFGLNLLTVVKGADAIQQAQAKNRLIHVFERTFPDTSHMLLEKYLGNIAPVFFANPGHALSEVPLFLRDDAFRSGMVKHVKNIFVRDFWEEEFNALSPSRRQTETASLSTRINRFVRSDIIGNIIGQSQTTIDFRKAIENREIILVRLPVKTLPEEASFIGTLLVAQIHAAIFSFADMKLEDRPGFSLFVDEFQHFATSDFAEMFTEGRKFGSRVCIAHQFREQIPDFLRDATLTARTIITFQTTAKNAGSMVDVYREEATTVQKEDIELNVTKYLLSHGHSAFVVDHFIKDYLRPLQLMDRWKGRVVIKTFLREMLNNVAYVDDPTLHLNALLYEVQTKGDGTLPIPFEVIRGFSNSGAKFYNTLNFLSDEGKAVITREASIQNIHRYFDRAPRTSEEKQLADFIVTFRGTMKVLADDPLGEKKSRTSAEIAQEIGSLPRRQAYVKVGKEISLAQTIDVPNAVHAGELHNRKSWIKKRTRSIYGKSADIVEREIMERQKKGRGMFTEDGTKENDTMQSSNGNSENSSIGDNKQEKIRRSFEVSEDD